MEGLIEQIKSPYFFKDTRYDGTFDDMINAWINFEKMDSPVMHLWLPASATKEQVELVKRMICGKI